MRSAAVICVTTPMSLSLFGNRLHLLIESGVELHVVVGTPITGTIPRLPSEAMVHIVPMKRSINPIGDTRALMKMVRLQRRLRPKLVATATPKASFIGLLAAWINRVPVRVWEVWGAKWDGPPTMKNALLMRLDRLTGKCATQIIAVSESLSQMLLDRNVVTRPPQVIGNGSTMGVDTDVFYPAPEDHTTGSPTIGFVGRLSQDKGVEDLHTIAEMVRQEVPGLRLLLVGDIDPTDPPPQQVIESLNKADWVEITGWTPSPAPYYRQMNVLVFPSRREGLPNALLEAASSGTPAIAFNVTGCKDLIQDGVTGYIIQAGDIASMAERTLRVLHSTEITQNMGLASRAFAITRFKCETIEQLWTQMYLMLLDEPDLTPAG